jgi:hypothetical protein
MAYQSGILGVTSALEWAHLNISKMYAGVVGVQGLGNVENCILYNCNITNCGLRGVWLTNQNVLNWQVYGGGAAQCGWLSTFEIAGGTGEWGGGYYAGSGSIGCLYGLSCSGNQWDVYGGQQCHVIGGSFEGGPNFTCSLSWAAGTATITTSPYPHNLRFDQPIAVFQTSLPGYEGRFNGHITGPNTITYPLVSNPGSTGSGYVAPTNAGGITNISYPMALSGLAFRGGDSDYYLPIYCAGTLTVDACSVSVAHAGNTGYISYLSNGSISFNQCAFNSWTNASFKNAGSSRIYLKGTQWIGTPTNPFSQFTGGTIMEYDLVQNITVATLPTAAATLTGLRGSVTDLNIARAFGGSVLTHGGGSTFCPVVCTGADWIMG